MKYERIYPVACPEPGCNAGVGEPCNTRNGLTHIDRLREQTVLIQTKALAARRGYPQTHPGQTLFQDPPKHCGCAERRKT